MAVSVINNKGAFWQLGYWVRHLDLATKYPSQEEAENVMAIAPRKFHGCRTVMNPHPTSRQPLPDLPVWEFPHKELENLPFGMSLGFFNQSKE